MLNAFDLEDYEVLADAKGAWLHLSDPNGDLLYNTEGGPVRINLIGPDHPEFRRKVYEKYNAGLRSKKKKAPGTETIEQQRDENIEWAVECTLGWEGFSLKGNPLPFTRDNARMVYGKPAFSFIFEQVTAFSADRANFLPNLESA